MLVSWHIENHDKVTSTQDILKELARHGKPEGTVVQAVQQTAGRGRHGRNWISDKGNLYLSLLLKPAGEARHVGQMGLLTGVAVAEAVQKYITDPDMVSLKWPNDVMIQGQKCAGILVETELTPKNSLSWLGVGIGVNIVSAPKGLGVHIQKYAAREYGLTAFRTSLLTLIDKYYTLWQKEGFDPIRENWLKYAHKKGSKIGVRLGRETVEGNFQGIDENGNLLMTDHDLELRKITAGEVY